LAIVTRTIVPENDSIKALSISLAVCAGSRGRERPADCIRPPGVRPVHQPWPHRIRPWCKCNIDGPIKPLQPAS